MMKRRCVRHRWWLRVDGEPHRSTLRVFTGRSCCGLRAKGGPGKVGARVTRKHCRRCRRCHTS